MRRRVQLAKACRFCQGKVRLVRRGRTTGAAGTLKVVAVVAGIVVAAGLGAAEIMAFGVIHYYLVPLAGVMAGGVIWGIAEKQPKFMDYRCLACGKSFSVRY